MKTVITNCHLIDGVSSEPIHDATVVIQDSKIAEVITRGKASDIQEAKVIDARDGWLLPGLWDVHVHLASSERVPRDLPSRTIQYGLNAAEGLLEAGITTIRTAGVEHWIDVAWKHAFASGQFLGPRIFAAGYFLTTTAGHLPNDPSTKECDGPEGFVQAIREQIKNGVDHIKLNLSGGIMGPSWDRHWHSFLTKDEIEAAFAICHQREFKVMSHATNTNAVKEAIRLGTWSVEHGYIMDEECIQMMLENNTIYVPTLLISHMTPGQVTNQWEQRWVDAWHLTPDLIERAKNASPEHTKWFQTALKAGVRMALGSDCFYGAIKEAALLELGLWVRDGATPMQAIMAATRVAAETCCVGDQLGTVQPNKIADLILVADNPLENINNLHSLQMVFKEGNLVVDKRE